jgi:cathepsin A (carboxypeptidase C)
MLFIEHPPSVGYSYCHDKHCSWNDTTQAAANFKGLQQFYAEFPEFKKNEFFITGESYGGMCVPNPNPLTLTPNSNPASFAIAIASP